MLALPLFALLALAAPSAAAPAVAGPDPDGCLACHADPGLTLDLADGNKRKLHVDASQHSVHAGKVSCSGCHMGFTSEDAHPTWDSSSLAAYRAGFRDLCRTCHASEHGNAKSGIHYRLLSEGDARAPFCVDCHGAHDVRRPNVPRARISRTCGRCHADINRTYVASVHGKALLEDNPDVPACTDCHHAHDIKDPRQRVWLLDSPEMCGRCHADRDLAARYNMSPNVLKSYVADFHGMTAGLQKRNGGAGVASTALCVDCHGIHDIRKVKDPRSPVLQANLQKTCAKCHAGAQATFPAAWLSHYEPTFERAPLVAGVLLFYRTFIPYVIGGLLLQVLFRAWRLVKS